jgi:hypothetical protein
MRKRMRRGDHDRNKYRRNAKNFMRIIMMVKFQLSDPRNLDSDDGGRNQ